ncbi:ATP-binding protein [Pedobacter roseus]|uniref:ATP-binding protein n=1 Tax=Pedobacter roseus TaxID=336820 RepID=A0A7G9QHR6_9SPHI|nr:ATP-binding protein [Pedobacter roseus]QNN42891.1 ATP-binding protein [Pedobacter roseus]
MILQSILSQIIQAQSLNIANKDIGLKRDTLPLLPNLAAHALIVSGIRRCGKSTLLFQLLNSKYPDALYLNFEDPRLYEFENNDFLRLDNLIREQNISVLMFDEIQIIPEWERYVRQKLDEGYKIVVTGSNASLLSRELGTKLTGRHITKELFPFSYHEFISYQKLEPSSESLISYLEIGGFPEYIKERTDDILNHLFEDILIRDIVVRYNIKDVRTLQRLAQYLISNVGKPVSGNKLKNIFEVGATSTVLEYLSHMEYSYLLHFVPKFSYSLKKQIANPRKVYAIDTGLINVNSGSFTEDSGRKFENLIFLHLRRTHKEIYYFSEKGECDFIIFKNGAFHQAIQVCYELNPDNLDREINGMIEALELFNSKEGTLITTSQKDQFEKNGKIIHVIPAYEYLLK